jgi:hypothetical protein
VRSVFIASALLKVAIHPPKEPDLIKVTTKKPNEKEHRMKLTTAKSANLFVALASPFLITVPAETL